MLRSVTKHKANYSYKGRKATMFEEGILKGKNIWCVQLVNTVKALLHSRWMQSTFFVTCALSDWINDSWGHPHAGPASRGCGAA
jgi:hypothetical protein